MHHGRTQYAGYERRGEAQKFLEEWTGKAQTRLPKHVGGRGRRKQCPGHQSTVKEALNAPSQKHDKPDIDTDREKEPAYGTTRTERRTFRRQEIGGRYKPYQVDQKAHEEDVVKDRKSTRLNSSHDQI